MASVAPTQEDQETQQGKQCCLCTVKNDVLYNTHLVVCKILGVLICTPCVMQHTNSVNQHAQGVTQHPCRHRLQCYPAFNIKCALNQLSQQQGKITCTRLYFRPMRFFFLSCMYMYNITLLKRVVYTTQPMPKVSGLYINM